MNKFPLYLSDYPNMDSNFPFNLSINKINTSFPAHHHDFFEFSLVIEGRGYEIIDGRSHTMRRGTFTFISPYQIHELHAEIGHPLKLYNCTFDINLLFRSTKTEDALIQFLVGEHNIGVATSYIQLEDVDRLKFESILQEILSEYEGDEFARVFLIRANLIEVIVRYFRFRRKEILENMKENFDNTCFTEGLIWKVINYIHSHYNEPISLANCAQMFYVSSPYLSSKFRHLAGKTFVSFLHDVRIRHACSFLDSTELSISTIAYEVGYNSLKTFSRAFRKRKNMTPSSYRRNINRNTFESVTEQ